MVVVVDRSGVIGALNWSSMLLVVDLMVYESCMVVIYKFE